MADNENIISSRVIGEGKDPLSEGNTMTVADDGHYELLETSEGVRQAEKRQARMAEEYHTAPTTVGPRHKAMPNKSSEELVKVVKTSKRKGR